MVRRIGASGPGPSGAPWKRVCIKKVWTFCVRLVLKLGIFFSLWFLLWCSSVLERSVGLVTCSGFQNLKSFQLPARVLASYGFCLCQ